MIAWIALGLIVAQWAAFAGFVLAVRRVLKRSPAARVLAQAATMTMGREQPPADG